MHGVELINRSHCIVGWIREFQAVRWVGGTVQAVRQRIALGERRRAVRGQDVGGRGDRLSDRNDRRCAGGGLGVRKVYTGLYRKQVAAAGELEARAAAQRAWQNGGRIAAVYSLFIARQF